MNMGIPVNAAPATDVDPLRRGDDREPWITADGNTIYFKSDRLATTSPRNNNDLFVTRKINGVWSEPELIGAPISTNVGDEHCPAILQDGETLCFASRREGGYGGGGRGGYGGGPREGGEGDGFRQQRPRRDMPPVERGPRQSGTVKFFKNDKGFGFITPDEGDADVFVHISAVERSGFAGLDSGQRVSFETEPDRRGKGPKAVNLQALEEGDAPQEDDGGPAEE